MTKLVHTPVPIAMSSIRSWLRPHPNRNSAIPAALRSFIIVIDDPKASRRGGIHRETFEAAHVICLALYKVFTFTELRNRKPHPLYVETCAEGAIMKGACLFYDSLYNVLCLRSSWSKEAVTQNESFHPR